MALIVANGAFALELPGGDFFSDSPHIPAQAKTAIENANVRSETCRKPKRSEMREPLDEAETAPGCISFPLVGNLHAIAEEWCS
jgi:hypothetical protein